MNPLHIYRPALEKPYPKTKEEYSHQMRIHLQDMEDWIRMTHTEGGDKPAMCQLWTMEHKDGRIANLPDQCPYEKLHRQSEKRQKAWLRYYMKKQERKTLKNQNTMSKKQKAKYSGSVLFNGKLNVTIGGEKKTLEIDYLGTGIKNADPNREVIVMLKKNIGYNEFDTGYVVRKEEWENMEQPAFGLSPTEEKDGYILVSYGDVIAWGYASDEEPEQVDERIEEIHRNPIYQCAKKKIQDMNVCIAIQDKDGEIGIKAIVDKNEIEAYLVVSADYLAACLKTFQQFTKETPDIKEMHFFTKAQQWEEE